MKELKLYQVEIEELNDISSYTYLRTCCLYAHSEAEARADTNKILTEWTEKLAVRSMKLLSVKEIQPCRHVMLLGRID